LERVWYWDDFYDALIGRPGQAVARFSATVIDAKVIDGAVNGVARWSSLEHRGPAAPDRLRAQLRARIVLGLAAILVFMVSRTWWS